MRNREFLFDAAGGARGSRKNRRLTKYRESQEHTTPEVKNFDPTSRTGRVTRFTTRWRFFFARPTTLTGRTDGGRQGLRPRGIPVFAVDRVGRGARDPHARVQHERAAAGRRRGQCSEVAHQAQSVTPKTG